MRIYYQGEYLHFLDVNQKTKMKTNDFFCGVIEGRFAVLFRYPSEYPAKFKRTTYC
jgi:hypothetical protein